MTKPDLAAPLTRANVHPVRAAVGAVTATIASVAPVFLVGGLAVQMGEELDYSPAGLGLSVSVYFGVSALASVPSGHLVERHGAAQMARVGILARHVPPGRQGVSFGLKQAAIPLSTLLAGIAVPTIALTAGWRWLVAALAMLLAAGLRLLGSRMLRRRHVACEASR